MSVLVRHGYGLYQGKYVIVKKLASPSRLLTRTCPLKMEPMPTRGMATRAGADTRSPKGIFLLIIPAGTFCLGTWQVQRRKWKLNLIADLEAKTTAPLIDFPKDVDELENLEYRRVKLTGTFDHDREILLGPRPLLVGGDVRQSGSGLLSSGQSGYLVVTPFKLAHRDMTILINRGWVSQKQKKPEMRQEGQVAGMVDLTAVVRRAEKRVPFMPKRTQGSVVFIYRDVDSMAELVGASPVFLDAVETVPGGPQGAQTRVTMRNEHMSYILTWYSLSLATSYLWYRRFIQGKALV